MSTPSRFPELTVSGPPWQMGCQIGEGAREQIRGFCEVALDRVNVTTRVSRKSAEAAVAAALPRIEKYDAGMAEELRGMAHGAGVPLSEIVLLQIRNQLQADKEGGCTSFSLAGTCVASPVVGQNWDNDPALGPFTLVLTRRPVDQPAFTTVTQAGLIAYVGFNDAGIGLCLNSLPAPSRPEGVPHYFMVRRIFQGRSLTDAIKAVTEPERAIPANIMLATPQGPADLEVTIDQVHVLSDATQVTHANHALHPELVAINPQFGELIQSHDRQTRIDSLLGKREDRPWTVADLQAYLRDHQGYPRSLCRHQNEDAGHGFWQTVFSVIIEPQEQRMSLTRGTPCDREYEVYTMGR